MRRLGNLFRGDPAIWWCYLALSIVSALFVFSSIGMVAHGAPMAAWLKHMVFVVGSWVLAVLVSRTNYRRFAAFAKPALWVSIGLLVVVAFVFHGRWIPLGPFQFQPSEIAKIVLLVFIAKQLATGGERVTSLEFFLRAMGWVVFVSGLIVMENFSTAAMVSVICLLMMFFGGVNLKYWWRTVAVLTVGAGIFLTMSYHKFDSQVRSGQLEPRSEAAIGRGDTWAHRVYTWVKNDPNEDNQINKAHMAVARGGLLGKGVGNTVIARLTPQTHSDFIFSIIIEEGGFLAGALVFLIYAFLCLRCVKMANRCRGTFGSLLLGGLGTYILVQALVHMSYNVGVIPVTGQTLPLVSHGGTSYVMFGIAIGIIQSVCGDVRKKEKAEREAAERQRGFEETYEIAKTMSDE